MFPLLMFPLLMVPCHAPAAADVPDAPAADDAKAASRYTIQ
jgi:hypothetical protein